jgi:hypothetical protein
MIGGKLHYRVAWRWRQLVNLCAYSVKDPSTLTNQQRFTRLYRSTLRRYSLINIARMAFWMPHHKNYFESVEKTRAKFEAAKKMSPEEYD